MMKLLLGVSLYLIATPLYSQDSPDTLLHRNLEEIVTQYATVDEAGFSILVAQNDRILYHEPFGMANIEVGAATTSQTIYQIGSITKLFTATAILQLAANNQLSLDDELQTYIPYFPTKGVTITIEHLLTHSSGIPNYYTLEHDDPFILTHDMEQEELIRFFMKEPLEFSPGSSSSYSNSGYFLLGVIIEVVSGTTYQDYLNDNIFEVADLTNTRYGSHSEIIPNRADGYLAISNGLVNAEYRSMSIPFSAGALLSTVEDLYKWHRSLLQGDLIPLEVYNASTNPFLLQDGSESGFGHGWFINQLMVQNRPTLLHAGGISGFSSMLLYLPEDDIFVAITANRNDLPVESMAVQMAATVLGEPLQAANMNPDFTDSLLGRYTMATDPSRSVIVDIENDILYVEEANRWQSRLELVEGLQYRVVDILGAPLMEFELDDSGVVVKLIVFQDGRNEWIKAQ